METERRVRLLRLVEQFFDYEETRTLASLLRIDFDSLRGERKSAKIRELITYIERVGKLDEFVEALLQMRPDLTIQLASFKGPSPPASDADVLRIELAGLRQQLDEIQKGAMTGEQLERRLEEMLKTASRAIGRSEELTGRLLLPPRELTDQPLLPLGSLERLEEYRSDENVAYLLIGAFVGAILGILSNWATNETFVITRISIVLQILFGVLAAICILWIRRLRQRTAKITDKVKSLVESYQESQTE